VFVTRADRWLAGLTLDDERVAQPYPIAYDFVMGVRPDDIDLRDQVDKILEKDQPGIEAPLWAYHVPQVSN
jgi:hypothetical protein